MGLGDTVLSRQTSLGFSAKLSGSTTVVVDKLLGMDTSWNVKYAEAGSGSAQCPARGWAFMGSTFGYFGATQTQRRIDIIDNPTITLKLASGTFAKKSYIYLSGAGSWTQTVPANHGDLVQVVGVPINNTEFRPLMGAPYIQYSGNAREQKNVDLIPWHNAW